LNLHNNRNIVFLNVYIDNDYHFAVVRVYEEVGRIDPNGAQTIKNAWAGGMAHVDGYIFPCLRCGNPAQQVFSSSLSP
jgi:hypothetical protein